MRENLSQLEKSMAMTINWTEVCQRVVVVGAEDVSEVDTQGHGLSP